MLLRLLLTVVLFAGLVSAQENNGNEIIVSDLQPSLNNVSLDEIFSMIPDENNAFVNIAPIRIAEELTQLENENIDEVMESIDRFNKLIANHQNIGSQEQAVKSPNDYDTCETNFNYTECTFYRDKGEYSITIVQGIAQMYTTYTVYYSGVFEGVDYGEKYKIQDHYIQKDGKVLNILFYRPPVPPESANNIHHEYDFRIFDDSTTIYTPWGTFDNKVLVFKEIFYEWEVNSRVNHQNIHQTASIDKNILRLGIDFWNINKEELYHAWVAMWDFEEMEGTWMSFDPDGRLKNTGPM